MKSYVFKVIVEPDEDVWHARVPELESKGAASWGKSQEEALRNIQEVARMVIEEMLEDGEPLPVWLKCRPDGNGKISKDCN